MTARDTERGSFLFINRRWSAALSATCLADTVDPRGPKPK